MATVKYKECDRCQKKIDDLVACWFKKVPKFSWMIGGFEYDKELCRTCYMALLDFLNNKPDSGEERQ